jgi:hypothetical protein
MRRQFLGWSMVQGWPWILPLLQGYVESKFAGSTG